MTAPLRRRASDQQSDPITRNIWCCGCDSNVSARLTDGQEIYPHRRDLAELPFWRCDACGNKVGCHHKTKNRTKPLGVIPTPEITAARRKIHAVLDPVWQSGRIDRRALYLAMAYRLGVSEYHTADIRCMVEAERAMKEAQALSKEATP